MEREGLEIGLERTIDLGELAEEETEPQVPPPAQFKIGKSRLRRNPTRRPKHGRGRGVT